MAVPTISEKKLAAWTAPAFGNEDELAEKTERQIREAVDRHPLLSTLSISVYAKGSYKNNTNVRHDSDVDIAVEYTDIVHFEYGSGTDQEQVWSARGIQPYSGPLRDSGGVFDIDRFKDAIGEALVGAFGAAIVARHNKVFTVRESVHLLAADVVPCTTHNHHWSPTGYARGIQLLADQPPRRSVVNYPTQHYANGVAKNKATGKAFKRVVRILKNLENQMVEEGASPPLASYLIESLVYNCPDSSFLGDTWAPKVRAVLVHIWEDTKESECEKNWLEVNEIKYLFHPRQPWTRDEARRFAHAAWQYVAES
jgi:hypothetical protein